MTARPIRSILHYPYGAAGHRRRPILPAALRLCRFLPRPLAILVLAFLCSGQTSGGRYFEAKIPFRAHLREYTNWASGHAAQLGKKVTMYLPFVDIYDPAGISVYHGEDPAKNAEILRNLDRTIPENTPHPIRPTLTEYVRMVPDFKGRESAILAPQGYAILSVTVRGSARCAIQNDEIARIRRSGKMAFKVLEVVLEP